MAQIIQVEAVTNSGVQIGVQSGSLHYGNVHNGDVNNYTYLQNGNKNDAKDKDANVHRHKELRKARIGRGAVSIAASSEPEPCDWVLKRDSYQDWDKDEARTSVLWIQGRVAGCGKSTIVSRIVDEFKDRSAREEIHLLYFYISATNEKLRSRGAVLRSFMDQMMDCSLAAEHIRSTLVNPGSSPDQNNPESLEDADIQDGLFRYLRHEAELPVYIVVDAVDELDPADRYWLIKTLIEEHESISRHSRFKILLSSRDDAGINTIRNLPTTVGHHTKFRTLEIQPKDIAGDIHSFIQRELVPICTELGHGPDSNWQTSIVKKLTECANGMFLWAYYQMKIISCMRSHNLISRHVNKIYISGRSSTDGINDFYKQTMEKIMDVRVTQDEREVARKVFTLLIHASGPIAVDALLEAIFASPDELEEWKSDPKGIVRICRYLVDMDEDICIFRWTHYSVYEYFTTPRKDIQSPKQPHQDLAFEETSDDALIAELCLSYLCRDTFARGKQINSARYGNSPLKTCINQHRFLEFASTQWACYSRSSMTDGKVRTRLLKLCKKESNMQLAFQVFLLSRHAHTVHDVHLTHIISYFHLYDLFEDLACERLLETGARAGNGFTAIHWAIDGHNSLADKRFSEEDPQVAIARHQQSVLDTVEKLVAYGADINVQDGEGRTPLYLAAKQGYLNVVTKLLQTKGILVNCHSKGLGTPLIVASYKGHADIVEKLIEARANITTSCELGTALHAAASQGSKECVSVILKKGSARSLDIALPQIGTPLHEAAYYGHSEIVEMLLSKGFKVNSMSDNYGSPLQAAAVGCYRKEDPTDFKKIFEMLFKFGADVNARGGSFTTALHASSHYGHLELVEMLLKNGADIHIESPNGTALQVAEQEGSMGVVERLHKHEASNPAPASSKKISKADKKSDDSSKEGEVQRQWSFFYTISRVPMKIFMTALKADDQKRMEFYFKAYKSRAEWAINANKIAILGMLASVGEQIFKDVISLTVVRHTPQAAESYPASQTLDTQRNFGEMAYTFLNGPWNLILLVVAVLARVFNIWAQTPKARLIDETAHQPKLEQSFPTIAGSKPEDIPFYSEDPAFRTLDRLTAIGISILGDAIDKKNAAAVDVLSKVWTRALYQIHSQVDIGDEMLKDLLNKRTEELMSLLEKGEEEAGKRIARVAVQLIATAIGEGETYNPLVCSLANIWALAMGKIHKLGERNGHDHLSLFLQAIIEDIKMALKKGDSAKIEHLSQVVVAIFAHVITERLDSLFDRMAEICLEVWDMITAPAFPKGQLIHEALEGKADTFIDFLRSVVANNRKDIFEFAMEQGNGIADDLSAVFSKYGARRPEVVKIM
ncbi:hypothetical protein TWF696_000927 [Orbilia brochopaga]|uniref:Nephrocystin 3-like N-terminal domain-containing protein n=1 Tax=Orbilia brochopaga TaxID=3140254 RepID=A0AAV9VCS7_9PEZI